MDDKVKEYRISWKEHVKNTNSEGTSPEIFKYKPRDKKDIQRPYKR